MTHEPQPDVEHRLWDELPDADGIDAEPLEDVPAGDVELVDLPVDVDAELEQVRRG